MRLTSDEHISLRDDLIGQSVGKARLIGRPRKSSGILQSLNIEVHPPMCHVAIKKPCIPGQEWHSRADIFRRPLYLNLQRTTGRDKDLTVLMASMSVRSRQ
ncbi:hypothetical protein HRR83_002237 [Exophiala dermatitidis]|uniref:Uncharacterized protein n=1 Tax=Exophiala dermatitidis TaxID=5970 RepID=A0AAN6EWU5_EXODE|nr:hypothetical protein HRR74_002314 [Exophiala dermatitidis]KAJ4525609.1 hypothetical protein HRR73_002341 [Exophiala dermatitidis]KAJ4536926.1 hypothetical protein HRR76_004953 [Exophiala dermatitidis]KAJ4555473.1 hypothetical protein HRR77_001402 [Exophiala dermatitidis]KAJ4572210.1 hypothetical protein HRR79_003417 [Exophiala dermatitidis]